MYLAVTGLVSPPSILTTRPFSTVTSSVHESGQSSGQAVRTVECPQDSAEAVRRMGELSHGGGAARAADAIGALGTGVRSLIHRATSLGVMQAADPTPAPWFRRATRRRCRYP